MAGAVIHKKKALAFLSAKLLVHRTEPVNKNDAGHPGFFIGCVCHRKRFDVLKATWFG